MYTRYVSKKNLAARLGVTGSTLDRWCRAGLFPAPLQVGGATGVCRWPEEQISAWEAAQLAKAQESAA